MGIYRWHEKKTMVFMGCAVGRAQITTPNITLLVVMQHLYYKTRIGPRLISVDAQDTTHSPILIHSIIHSLISFLAFLHALLYQLLAVSSSKLLGHSPIATKNLPGSSSKLPKPAPKLAKIPVSL